MHGVRNPLETSDVLPVKSGNSVRALTSFTQVMVDELSLCMCRTIVRGLAKRLGLGPAI